MTDIFNHHGPDSWLGQLASTMQASSDTTLYIVTVYFGSIGIRNYRYALKVGLLADLVSVLASVFAVTTVVRPTCIRTSVLSSQTRHFLTRFGQPL